MKAALAQIGMAGARNRDRCLVAGDDRLDHLRAARAARIAGREHGGHYGTARMHRALAIAVVELDAVAGGAAEKGRIEQVGAARAARHRDVAGPAHGGEHPLRAVCDVARGATNHDADGVEEMPPRIMPNLGVERAVTQAVDESDERRRRSRRWLQSCGPLRHAT